MSKFESLCNEYRENKRMIDELNAMNEAVKASIIDLMAGADTVVQGTAKATNKLVESVRLDTTAIKKELPEVFNKYSKHSTYTRFNVI